MKSKNRIDLAVMFGQLGFKRGVEVGVRTGRFSAILCTHVKGLKQLYSVDPWDLVFEDPTSEEYLREFGPDVLNRFYRQAVRRLRKYPVCQIIRKTSLEAVRDFKYDSLDFVYIDGSHTFDYVMVDIIEWTKRVRKGGIVSGDDYQPLKRYGDVITPVNTYVEAHGIETLNLMEPGEKDESPSVKWWFVKA